MNTFQLGPKVISGSDALDKILELPAKKTVVVCDPFLAKSGASRNVTDRLDKLGSTWELFDKVVPDPTVEVVSQCVGLMMSVKPDTVIALGGGSAIDTAKAAGYIFATQGGSRPSLVAIPTTSGTGSEVTSFSVISDPDKGVKYPIIDDALLPDFAILDPHLTLTVPKGVTADTGLDVLTHALEAYVAVDANQTTDALAEKATQIVFDCLDHVVAHGDDLEARQVMHEASNMAGIAFNNAGLGACHAMAHAMGAAIHLPHGRCNALLLPHVVRMNAEDPAVCAKYARIAARVGCCCYNDSVAVDGLVRKIEQLMHDVKVAPRIEDAEKAAALRASVADVAEKAMADRCMPANPVSVSKQQIIDIYQRIC